MLEDGARSLGITLPSGAPDRFATYLGEILRWKRRVGITGLTTEEAIVRDGFLDSLACLLALGPGPLVAVDIGSGAGFPGLPVKIVRDDVSITLIEASRRRHSFLAHAVRLLGVNGVDCVRGRAEVLGKAEGLRGRFDVAFGRAVAPPQTVAALARPFLREGGIFLAQIGAVFPEAHFPGYRLTGRVNYHVLGIPRAILSYGKVPGHCFT